MKALFTFLFSFLLFNFALAQVDPSSKHPRVAEVEEKISEEASSYFVRRFPSMPFAVRVEVEPLRAKLSAAETQKSLPYFDYEGESEIDLWDDLSIPVSYLRNRVVKVTLNVTLPSDFEESKFESMKQDLMLYLRLAPFRDDVRFERKLAPKSTEIPQHYYYVLGTLLLSALILGGMIKWSAGTVKTTGTGSASSGAPAVSLGGSATGPGPQVRDSGKKISGPISLNEVTVNDSLKVWDLAHGRIKSIIESGTFPTFSDILAMDQLASLGSSKLGALLFELPTEVQKNVMKFGRGESWLEAFSNPGKLDNDCLDTLEKMARNRNYKSGNSEMETLLIQIWRMEKLAESFIKVIPQDHSFAVLDSLPKSIALPLARRLYPGGWAKLLDRKQLALVPDSSIVVEYVDKTCEVMPLYDDVMLDQYKKDREILSYLDSVNIQDEKEVYEVLADDSFVKKIRKPFYPVFNLPQEKFSDLVNKVPLEAWAFVTAHSPRSYVKMILDVLDDKKKIIFTGYLKKMDLDHVSISEVISSRDQILNVAYGSFPEEFLKNMTEEVVAVQDEKGRESA